ncbi:DUF3037 domain-containing protein [Erwinia rhapontici]|uniref:DUF3037 domain-containing protein n=1 Tax=Erwinia rhapontici TaxID=55212 RepID=UPI00143845CF|nr:DUF3037 domain-containing protein [Erwinia rhapontici]NKG30391.1 DUF3037 domain-containing protein [Erwinia rhapontici]
MTTPCLYSIVRYAPYAETEEFANVGVVLCAPKMNKFCFYLTNSNNNRVKNFFKDDTIFPFAKDAIARELKFAQDQAAGIIAPDKLANFFNYLIAKKESVINFSSARVIMATDPDATAINIFNKFVNHSDVTKESREIILTRELRNRLSYYSDLKHVLKKETLGGELTRFSIPFVAKKDGQVICAIKPLAFTQDKPEKMMEHCDSWAAKVLRAASEQVLNLSNVLFTIDPPYRPNSLETKAIQEIRRTFTSLGINHVEHEDENSIVKFARQSL